MTTTKNNKANEATTEGRRGFLCLWSGNVENSDSKYIFHGEGFIGGEPVYRPGTDATQSYIRFSVGLGVNAWTILGKDEAAKHQETNFVDCVAFGALADRIHETADKGRKVAISGKVSVREYERKDGTKGEAVHVVLSGFYCLPSRDKSGANIDGDAIDAFIPHARHKYVTANGEERVSDVAMLVGGEVSAVGPVNQTQTGTPVVSWKLKTEVPALKIKAVTDGSYASNTDYGNYKVLKCSSFGTRATNLANLLKKCNKILVTGSLTSRQYNGQTYVDMNVRELSVLEWKTFEEPENAPAAPADEPEHTVQMANYDAEDFDDGFNDDDLPF